MLTRRDNQDQFPDSTTSKIESPKLVLSENMVPSYSQSLQRLHAAAATTLSDRTGPTKPREAEGSFGALGLSGLAFGGYDRQQCSRSPSSSHGGLLSLGYFQETLTSTWDLDGSGAVPPEVWTPTPPPEQPTTLPFDFGVQQSPPAHRSPSPQQSAPSRSRKTVKRPDSHTPRPPNAWILYRSEQIRLLRDNSQVSRRPQSEISKLIGFMWRDESAEVKRYYEEQADQKKREHAEKYPEYQFLPVRRGSSIAGPPKSENRGSRKRGSSSASRATPYEHLETSFHPQQPPSAPSKPAVLPSVLAPIPSTTPTLPIPAPVFEKQPNWAVQHSRSASFPTVSTDVSSSSGTWYPVPVAKEWAGPRSAPPTTTYFDFSYPNRDIPIPTQRPHSSGEGMNDSACPDFSFSPMSTTDSLPPASPIDTSFPSYVDENQYYSTLTDFIHPENLDGACSINFDFSYAFPH